LIKEILLVTDEKGRRHLARLTDEMVSIPNLGTIRADSIVGALKSGELTIGGKKLLVRPATVDDVLSVIERKAQMLTSKDIAMMIHLCDVRCGSKVVEGGAGSGALSIALLASVGEEGKVTTYEIREDFAEIARRNVEMVSLGRAWTLKIGDVCKEIEERDLDALLIDIPNPWGCVGTAKQSLRTGGRFCAFVPNVNQVEKAVNALRDNGFSDVRAVETMQRDMVVHDGGVRPSFDMLGHTGYLVLARR
jgi:tRNA (adenine57-N1/adenine58-N1)-methyltransferase catalytic subunit